MEREDRDCFRATLPQRFAQAAARTMKADGTPLEEPTPNREIRVEEWVSSQTGCSYLRIFQPVGSLLLMEREDVQWLIDQLEQVKEKLP